MNRSDIKNKIIFWIPKILAILLGVFFIVFGEFDDSPGLQGVGLILIIATVVIVIRGRNKK
jgi:drug/metabolite transporter (DMT)-like permease